MFTEQATQLMQRLGVSIPLLLAPMAGVADAGLAIAVARAGGLGAIPAALLTPEQLRAEVERFRAARRLRGETAVRPKLRNQSNDRTGPAVDPLVERRIDHRHHKARIGEHRVGKIAVANLAGARHIEGVDKNRAAFFFINRLGVFLGEAADNDEVFRPILHLRILRWRHDFPEPSVVNEFLKQSPQRRILQSIVDEHRLLFRRYHILNAMRDFAEHARAEGAMAQAGNDVADAFAFL